MHEIFAAARLRMNKKRWAILAELLLTLSAF
jgi:hypothetical protein